MNTKLFRLVKIIALIVLLFFFSDVCSNTINHSGEHGSFSIDRYNLGLFVFEIRDERTIGILMSSSFFVTLNVLAPNANFVIGWHIKYFIQTNAVC